MHLIASRYQQDALCQAGFPMFKVSESMTDLVHQHWVLAPYLEAAINSDVLADVAVHGQT